MSGEQVDGTPHHAVGDAVGIDARLDAPRVRALALVVGVLAVSTAAVLVRIADAPALGLAWWRTSLATVALAPFAVWARVVPRGRQPLLLTGSGVLLAVHFALWFASLELTTVAASSVLVSMSPVIVGAGSAALLGEPPSRRTWIGLGLSVAGAVVIVAGDLGGASPRALLGDVLAFAAAVAVAGYLLVGRHVRRTLPVSVYATWTYGSAAVIVLVAALVTGTSLGIGPGPAYDRGTWLAIAGLVVGPQLLGHTVFNLVLARVSATVVAVVVISEPVGASLLAAALLGEAPAGLFYVGAPMVLAGVLLAASSSRTSGAEVTAAPAPR